MVHLSLFCLLSVNALVALGLNNGLTNSHSHKHRGPHHHHQQGYETKKELAARSTSWWTSNAAPSGGKKWVFAHLIVGNTYVSARGFR